jgi:hypothetical protein
MFECCVSTVHHTLLTKCRCLYFVLHALSSKEYHWTFHSRFLLSGAWYRNNSMRHTPSVNINKALAIRSSRQRVLVFIVLVVNT